MVGEEMALVAVQVWPEVSDSPYCTQCLQLGNAIVALMLLQAAAGISNGSH